MTRPITRPHGTPPKRGGGGRLEDRVILVAGATGMAGAAADRAAAEGARVFVVSRTPEHARDLAERLAAAGTAADWCAADLRDERATRDAVAAARARFGRIDGLCQVAGGSGRGFGDGPLHEVTLEAWDATLALNLSTQFLVMRETLRVMLEQPPGPAGRGSIVLMSSVSSFRPAPARFAAHAYAAAKAAVLGLVRATAAYYAPSGIRVNAVVPGLVRTPMSTRAQGDPSVQADAARRQPLTGAFLEPADVAGTIVHLLGDESRAVTGQLVAVDGGWSVSDASGWAGPAAPA